MSCTLGVIRGQRCRAGGAVSLHGFLAPLKDLYRSLIRSVLTMNTKHFTLPSLPPSINALYLIDTTGRRRYASGKPRVVYMSDEARKWKSDMQYLIPRFEIAEDSVMSICYVAYYPFLHRNGKHRRVDVHNLTKLLFDTVCARIGVDDSRVIKGSFEARNSQEEKLEVTLWELCSIQY